MEVVSEIIEKLANVEVSVECEVCRAVQTFVGKQYSTRCRKCGTNITLTPRYLVRLKQFEYRAKYGELEERHRCSFCRDSGSVILEEQMDDQLAAFAYRCLCQAGQKRPEAWPVVPSAKVMHLRLIQPDTEAREEKLSP